ncbi:MAG: hypothetical protein H3C43_09895 [Leptonema sp. (in: Bacteria)]|nr:hypothetical protein [Leptonema sp. (in: bacteria)]
MQTEPELNMPKEPVAELPPTWLFLVGGLLLLVGGFIIFLLSDSSSEIEVCLGNISTIHGFQVLTDDLRLESIDSINCNAGPFIRYGEGSLLARNEFRPFLKQWQQAVKRYPTLLDYVSEIELHRNGDSVFFTQQSRFRIEVSSEVRSWPYTLMPLIEALESTKMTANRKSNDATRGFVDLKDEDALLIETR